ncbi:Adenylate kinase/UMP-CMP kinase protein [Dioscorea alata]|uniref:Adenylate kinase/UMP-CMP kinase protein n=3 Tax=Dioscorea alata TaxID=55571 RepID=A0ACB7VDB0_DIOAL|nr:Adenylate kinase/UMP-CMP kinase protein [Dioscorea alata]KAH7671886.1 Adenylate kinase/UMP-CMP kinase protein [Dioscorea alata]KAH7671887.1 Adenylate kinase/UMP-CMP kinase protein [Dioscorea alata]
MAAIATTATSTAGRTSRSFSFPCSPPPPPTPLTFPRRGCAVSIRSKNIRIRNPRSKGLRRVECLAREPLKVMISGAPASGKGTQCEMIVEKYGLVHISTGDLLRAEVSSGSEVGMKAKEYMESGRLVPDEVVTEMVIARLSQPDAKEKGWLLDGYPRSPAQAQSLEKLKIRPDVFIILDVPDEILIDRCVGRRLDPLTGKIYHLKNFPPETEDISARLITRSDDTEEKVKTRLETYKKNAEVIFSTYMDLLTKVDGNRPKEAIFEEIDSLLQRICEGKLAPVKSIDLKLGSSSQDNWRGIPTRLNNIPHSREIREYFYEDVLQATQRAVQDKRFRLKVEINIPELNPEMDVYRIGTLMELVRTLALSFADDGKHVKVCVQGSMGEGALAGMPLQLAGTRRILDYMDWGDYGAKGTFINIGSIGAKEVDEHDDIFILMAPQNAVGNCIIDDMKAMTDAAGDRPVILINPRLKDLPGSSGIMQTMGRDKRLEYTASFESCYSFRLLYYAGTQYPIMGALRMSYPYRYELYKRVDEPSGKEKYVIVATFPKQPTIDEVNDAFQGKPRNKEKTASGGIWGFLSGIF